MRGQSPIPKVAPALPAPACSGHWATGERSMSPNKVPKKAGRDWVSAAVLRRRRRGRPTVTADASGVFGLGAEVVGSIRAVSGSLISDIFSPRTESNLEHGNERAGGGLTSLG
ncbi:uncharacterized protein CCOS01_15996 [Colletotrichum costaricense]|uniref:Uncharacterized protein n=1 Tax=Colletotrichum costaricense TaxID=1209916 RepID=A0AAI9YGC3_9PEZI|nr:uncharacterized protein CCOS01_15996 [Colletotrichum costaricense]KAK1507995.1 hypothetical protein CCOS01_15996 [Colletotrichum costaricense]